MLDWINYQERDYRLSEEFKQFTALVDTVINENEDTTTRMIRERLGDQCIDKWLGDAIDALVGHKIALVKIMPVRYYRRISPTMQFMAIYDAPECRLSNRFSCGKEINNEQTNI